MNIEIPKYVKNHQDLINILGYWPTFHDDEIISVDLNPSETIGCIKIHSFNAKQDLIISFILKDIQRIELEDANNQNVIFEMLFSKLVDNIISIKIDSSHGIYGEILCRSVELKVLGPEA